MLNEKRVKHMIRLASYDEHSEEDLKIHSCFRKTYVRFHVLVSLLWITVGYIALVGIIGLSCMEALLENLTLSTLIMAGGTTVIGYFVTLVIYTFIATGFYRKKYDLAKQNVKKYVKDLQSLEKIYESEEA